jgi:transporter family-2 protein
MAIILILFAILAGMALPTQFSVNAQLRTVVGSPTIASAVSFIVGAFALLIVSLFGKGIYIMMKYGYARVFTLHQDSESQLQTLKNEGC